VHIGWNTIVWAEKELIVGKRLAVKVSMQLCHLEDHIQVSKFCRELPEKIGKEDKQE
jgi:hypothetical protein